MMKNILTLILFLVCCAFFQKAKAQTSTETFTYPVAISTNPQSPDYHYPAEIEVTGMPLHTIFVQVEFPQIIHDDDFSELDIVLESPSGFRSLIFSDAEHISSVQVLWAMRIFGTSNNIYDPDNPISFNHYRPYNVGSPDEFPIIGTVNGTQNTMYPFENTDPNGTWKLYFYDDTDNEFHGQLPSGWELKIKSGTDPICVRPEIPTLIEVVDTSATITWASSGDNTLWDIAYGFAPFTPSFATVPNFDNVSTPNSFQIDSLEFDGDYNVYVRSDCAGDDSDATSWVGPLNFQTGASICKQAMVMEDCQSYSLSSSNAYKLDGFEVYCPGAPNFTNKWIMEYTPTTTKEYFLNLDSPVVGLMMRPKVQECNTEGWVCINQDSIHISLGTLDANTTYQIYANDNSLIARISECPLLGTIELEEETPLVFEASVELSLNNLPLEGSFDVLLNVAGDLPPDATTIPQFPAYNIQGGEVGFTDLDEFTEYEFYVRESCATGKGCWQGPFEFKTFQYCGEIPPMRIQPRSVAAEIIFPNTLVHPERLDINFGPAPHARPAYVDNSSADIWSLNFSTTDSLRYTLFDLEINTDYEFYVRKGCASNGSAAVQEWIGPFSFTTNRTCFVEVQDLVCDVCYTAPPNYGHDFFDSGTNCSSDFNPSRGERIFKIQNDVDGVINLHREQSNSAGGNYAEYQFFLKSGSEICDLENWESLGCWVPSFGDNDFYIDVEADSVYYLLLDYRSESSFQDVSHTFTVNGPCSNPCPAVEEIEITAIDDNSVLVTWPALPDAVAYDILYYPSAGANPIPTSCNLDNFALPNIFHTDTTFVLGNLDFGTEYFVFVRPRCSELNYGPWLSTTASTQPTDTTSFSNDASLSFCSPFYQREESGTTNLYSYDELSFTVDAAGVYQIQQQMEGGSYLAVYSGIFDAQNPTANLQNPISTEDLNPDLLAHFYNLEVGQTYVVISTRKNQSFNSNQIDLTFIGTGNVSSDGYFYLGKRAAATGIIPPTGMQYASNRVCLDIDGWRHYYKTDNTNLHMDEDLLLFSLKDYPEIYNGTSGDTLAFGGAAGVSTIPYTTENYVQNPTGWTVMNRYWDLRLPDAVMQPTSPVAIRFYYTQADFEAMQDTLPADSILAHTDLFFYKINSNNQNYNPDPTSGHLDIPAAANCAADGLWNYANGAVADTATWKYGAYENHHFAEMKVHSFSGGGGGIGSPLAITDIVDGVENGLDLQKTNWTIFPNPSDDLITIQNKSGDENIQQIRIYDSTGKLVKFSIRDIATPIITYKINELQPALYFIKVIGTKSTEIIRLVKR